MKDASPRRSRGTKSNVQSARRALTAALADIEVRLEANPNWTALGRLDESIRLASAAASDDTTGQRAKLAARLDHDAPDWRLHAGLKAAIAALDEALQQADSAQARSTPAAVPRPNSRPPRSPKQAKSAAGTTPREAPTERPEGGMSLLERIQRVGDVRDSGDGSSSRHPPSNQAHAALVEPDHPKPSNEANDLATIEEAEVEIVSFEATGDVEAPEATQLAPRARWTEREATIDNELPASLQSSLDEASVEIIILEDGTEDPSQGGAARSTSEP